MDENLIVSPGVADRPSTDARLAEIVAGVIREHGYRGLTFERIASESGISTKTIHQRWETRAEMLLALSIGKTGERSSIKTGSLAEDLDAWVEWTADMFTGELGREVMSGLLADMDRDPDLSERLRQSFTSAARKDITTALDRAGVTSKPSGALQPPDRPTSRSPMVRGYVLTLGVLGGLLTGLAIFNLSSIVFSVFLSMFIAVGLDPLVRWLQRRGLTRGWATAAVIVMIVAVVVAVLGIVIPLLVEQIQRLSTAIPAEVIGLRNQGWFGEVNSLSNGLFGTILTWISEEVTRPQFLATVGTGAVGLGFSIANAIGSGIFIAILSIYFVGTYDSIREAAFGLVPASRRQNFAGYANQILRNVGRYLSGMVALALANAIFSVILLLIMGVPGAVVIGILAFLITLVPMIGTILTTIAMSLLALFHSPSAGLVVFIAMLVYMQIEAYVLTPKVMSKAVKIPGSVVLISALAGGTLFGLPGALVAIPISAGAILVLKEVVLPAKNRS